MNYIDKNMIVIMNKTTVHQIRLTDFLSNFIYHGI
jgi:hypothetical protein